MFLLPASFSSWINQQSTNFFLSDPKVVLQIIFYSFILVRNQTQLLVFISSCRLLTEPERLLQL